jgi:hypothetical protein
MAAVIAARSQGVRPALGFVIRMRLVINDRSSLQRYFVGAGAGVVTDPSGVEAVVPKPPYL